MPRSKDFRNYVIVTKKPNFSYHFFGQEKRSLKKIKDNHEETRDKTFWLYTRDGDLIGRYSVESAPHWIQEIYNIIVR